MVVLLTAVGAAAGDILRWADTDNIHDINDTVSRQDWRPEVAGCCGTRGRIF